MRELFFTLGVLALLRHLNFSGWWNIPLIVFVLYLDAFLRVVELKQQSEIESLLYKIWKGK